MKNNIPNYIPVIGVILIIAIFPFYFRNKTTESINQTITLSATVLSSLASIVTLWIALKLFNKYGIDASLIEKNSNKVFDLLEEIKTTQFSFASTGRMFYINMSNPFKYDKQIERFYTDKLIFPDTYINSLQKIFKINNSPFMPTDIAKEVDRLQFFLLSYDVPKETINNYVHVRIMGVKDKDEISFGRFNGKDITVLEFLNIINNIKNATEKWIRDNSVGTVKLNL